MSLGVDYESKMMTETEYGVFSEATINSKPHPASNDYFSEAAFDSTNELINQVIKQRSVGVFFIDKLDIVKKLYATLNLRYDYVYNRTRQQHSIARQLFSHPETGHSRIPLFVSALPMISQNTLISMPAMVQDSLFQRKMSYTIIRQQWGGFNESIKPSTFLGGELGLRGNVGKRLYYDVDGFYVNTKNDFYRYSIVGRGNNTAFFGNMGESTRYGLEVFASYIPVDFLKFNVAYTYSH